jgi:hypothetical protein
VDTRPRRQPWAERGNARPSDGSGGLDCFDLAGGVELLLLGAKAVVSKGMVPKGRIAGRGREPVKVIPPFLGEERSTS